MNGWNGEEMYSSCDGQLGTDCNGLLCGSTVFKTGNTHLLMWWLFIFFMLINKWHYKHYILGFVFTTSAKYYTLTHAPALLIPAILQESRCKCEIPVKLSEVRAAGGNVPQWRAGYDWGIFNIPSAASRDEWSQLQCRVNKTNNVWNIHLSTKRQLLGMMQTLVKESGFGLGEEGSVAPWPILGAGGTFRRTPLKLQPCESAKSPGLPKTYSSPCVAMVMGIDRSHIW